MYTSTILRALPVLVAILVPTTLAQTWSFCNPMNQTGCPNDIALGISNYSIDLTAQIMSNDVWNTTAGVIDYDYKNGAQFIIEKKLDSPTIQSNFHIFFGQVEVIMQAALGQGVVSSIVIQSDDLDEIDWEWIGGNTSHVQTNYFGKGNTTTYDRAIWHEVETPQALYHNYTTDWQKDKTDFYIDGQIIRTLKFEDANGGKNYPQTPADVRLGIWPGGDPRNNEYTIEWSGGEVDYDKAPFTMAVKSIRVSDASTATEYHWSDQTGSMESIEVIK
jgi:beta-glucanase (GH16 family)